MKVTLTAARVNAGLTLDEAAKQLNVSKGTLWSWEKGKTQIKANDFFRICELYHATKDDIFLPEY